MGPTVGPAGSTAPTQAAKTHAVQIVNYAFAPTSLSVAVGDSISFTNEDTATHDMAVQANEGYMADSGSIVNGATGTVTMAKAGTYTLYCTIHPQMTISVKVE